MGFVGRGGAGVLMVGLMGLGACAMHDLRNKFSSEYGCATDEVRVEQLNDEQYRVEGCAQTAYYECVRGDCTVIGVSADGPSYSPPASSETQPPKTREQARLSSAGSAGQGREKTEIVLDLSLPNRALLKLRARPETSGAKVQLWISRISDETEVASCQIELMVNGERLELPKTRPAKSTRLASLVVDLSRDIVLEMGVARQLGIRVCKDRWSLEPEQLAELHHFVTRYEEALAWLRDPKKGTAARLLAPSGGWPAWKVDAQLPAAVASGNPLDAQALYKAVSPSVFQIEAVSSGATAQGSAVAVSASELVTNCHVVEGARKLVVRQKKQEWRAKVARSDPKTDRCVLNVPDASFTPVRGVRAYSDLQVGEPLYTLGSPSGLELTLSNGILSGLREEEGRRFVQTTAPISPGSSGGGLFDGRGNLVGVTTLVLVGKQRLNQALNFAIAAESFWQP